MPTYSAITLDRLIEPRPSKSMANVKTAPDSKLERRSNSLNSRPERRNGASTATPVDKNHHWSPALYATPKSTPLPDSPSSYPPSPYIINHKRRGPRLLKSSSEDSVVTHKQDLHMEKVAENIEVAETKVSDSAVDVTCAVAHSPIEGVQVNGNYVSEHGSNELADSPNLSLEREDDAVEDFLDPQDSISVKCNTEVESNSGVERSYNLNTPGAEFFDAWEELSSENGPNGPQPSLHDFEAELRDMRLSLLMEIEKRKQAEEAQSNMQSQWLRIQQKLSLAGLTLPANLQADAVEGQLEVDPAEELCQQVYLARFVSNSIGRGTAKAEVEMEMEAQIESKNFEIARLWDRLHYYEAVNREMSQRNQEAVEMARRLRQKRRRRQRWVWGSIGAAAVVLGTAGLAWAYLLPSGEGSASTSQFVAPERNDAAAK